MELTERQVSDLNEHIKTLKEDYRYNIENFDKQSIYIATGALAICLTIINDIVSIENVLFLGFYYASIFCFSFSIIVRFISFPMSYELIFKRLIFL